MTTARCSAMTMIGLCSILGAAGACSSDSSPPATGDAQSDISADAAENDAAMPDATPPDVTATDAPRVDTSLSDALSSDVYVDGRVVDASLSDRAPNDSSTDESSGDAALSDASSTDSTLSDAPSADSSADAASADSTSDAPPGDGANDPSCQSWGAGGQCSGSTFCVYPEGNCQCASACGPPPLPDAGNHWFCSMRGAGCPIQKPAVGTSCSMDAQACNYGTCCADWMICESSAWKQGNRLCPP